MNAETKLMESWLNEDYPSHSEILLQLSLDDLGKKPLFSHHIDVAINYFDPNRLVFTPDLDYALRSSYSYMSSAIFCLDSLVDDHSRGTSVDIKNPEISKALTLFLVGSIVRLEKFALNSGLKDKGYDTAY